MEIHERNVVIKCHECGRDYEDAQVIVNGIPCCNFIYVRNVKEN